MVETSRSNHVLGVDAGTIGFLGTGRHYRSVDVGADPCVCPGNHRGVTPTETIVMGRAGGNKRRPREQILGAGLRSDHVLGVDAGTIGYLGRAARAGGGKYSPPSREGPSQIPASKRTVDQAGESVFLHWSERSRQRIHKTFLRRRGEPCE